MFHWSVSFICFVIGGIVGFGIHALLASDEAWKE